MPKSRSKVAFVALRKIFKETSADKIPLSSDHSTLEKLIPSAQNNPQISPSSSPIPKDRRKRVLSCLADKFVFQMKKASATNSEESLVAVQESCSVVTGDISSIIPCADVSHSHYTEPYSNQILNGVDRRKKETSRFRKQKILENSTKSTQYLKLMKLCVDKMDVESTLGIFDKLGREISLNEYKTLIRLWLEKIREINSADSLHYFQKVHQLFISMKERGFQILEDCYGPVLLYMIEMRMKKEFIVFTNFIKDYDHNSYNNIGYYEMLLLIKIGNEKKVKELCNSILADEYDCNNKLAESYLLALCENDRKEELIRLLEVFNLRSISSLKHASCIFKTMGRLQLDDFVENFILEFKTRGTDEENISSLIYDYASSIPNLVVRNFS